MKFLKRTANIILIIGVVIFLLSITGLIYLLYQQVLSIQYILFIAGIIILLFLGLIISLYLIVIKKSQLVNELNISNASGKSTSELGIEQLNKKIVDITPGLITVFNAKTGEYIYVNNAIVNILGYQVSDILNGGFQFVAGKIHPEDAPILLAKNAAAIESANDLYPNYQDSEIMDFEYRLQTIRGDYVWLKTYGIIFSRDADHKVEHLINVSVDITRQKAIELQLTDAQNNLKILNDELERTIRYRTQELEQEKIALKNEMERNNLVAKATNDVVWDWDLLNDTILWNENYRHLFGYSINNVEQDSTSWIAHLHPEDKERVVTEIALAISNGDQQWIGEYRFFRKDGSIARIFDRGYVVRDDDGIPYRMVGCMTDITINKEAEQKILSSELKFRRVFESNMIAMSFASFNGLVLDANNAFINMLGYSREELMEGKIHWDEITAPESKHKNKWEIEQLKTFGVCPTFEKDYMKKDGSRVSVLMGSAVLGDDDEADYVKYIIDISEQKATEARQLELHKIINKQQNEFHNIFMNAPALIAIRRGPDLRLEFANKAYQAYADLTKYIGKAINDSGDILYSPAISDEMFNVYNSGKAFYGKSYPFKYDKEHDGTMEDAWIDFIFEPVYDENGNIDGVANFGFDVTDIINANKEIKKNEDRFRFLADAIPQLVWTATPDGVVTYYNKVWVDYTGLDNKALDKWNWANVVNAEDLTGTEAAWHNSVRTGNDFEIEHRLKNSANEYRWHLTRALAQKDESGNITMWVGTNTDIHDQKTNTEQLRISEDYFRELADQSPLMIWKVDDIGLCSYVNQRWVDFTGLSFEESLGLGWGKAFHPDDTDVEYTKFMGCFNERIPYSSKFRISTTNGEYRWVLAQSNPLINNEFQGYIGSLTDITEQELMQQATRMLMQKKDEFMSIASHELKTPITSMKASLQIVERMSARSKESGNIHTFIKKANKHVNKLTNLVEDLLDVTKIHAGKMEFNRSTFSIKEIIQDSLDAIQPDENLHKISITGDTAIIIEADKHRIEQVLTNFISNAIKYSPGAGDIVIKVDSDANNLTLSVKDYGIGIPGDKIPFIFDRFFRVQESSQKFSGLGLGLYISAEIIHRHGGEIGVKSDDGQGSTFWFTLPLIAPATVFKENKETLPDELNNVKQLN